MKLFDILKLELPALKPEECKLHLAVTNNAGENPLDVFLAGEFPDWQSWQKHKSFERRYVEHYWPILQPRIEKMRKDENDETIFTVRGIL